MQSKHSITIVYTYIRTMAGMHKLYMCYTEHRRWMCVNRLMAIDAYMRSPRVLPLMAIDAYLRSPNIA